MKKQDKVISDRLTGWYNANKRELPWRETRNPYIIWVSEIILQQTRVAQGMDYFLRFVGRFPDVRSLAEATEPEVLKYWQGLGYYSRARNLHVAAQDIMERFDGQFPTQYKDVLSLKGIGEYTAAAIVSFAWNQPYPVVDGNVYRVLSRLFALDIPIDSTQGKKEFTRLATLLMPLAKAGLHNQAIMELGALQCLPQHPDCPNCPVAANCLAYRAGNVSAYPVKQHKSKTRNRYFHYFHIIYNGSTWLHRRNEKDIWAGLYEFPLIETASATDFIALRRMEEFRRLFEHNGTLSVTIERPKNKHILSHQTIYATFYRIEIERDNATLQSYLRIPANEMEQYPVSRLTHLYLSTL